MSGTKFMVIKFKELLKTAVFAVLGVIIIIAIVYFMVPRGEKTALYTPGTYTSSIIVDNELIDVSVEVDETKIKSVSLVHTSESVPVFYPLFEDAADTVGKEIVEKQSTNIDLPEDSSVTAKLIVNAVEESLSKAALK